MRTASVLLILGSLSYSSITSAQSAVSTFESVGLTWKVAAGHPEGPQAVGFVNSAGNHVIRYNDIWGDDDHYFNDAIGAGFNFSFEGFPNRDSDIYRNRISHAWDDGIEAEGANENVRIWGNFIDRTWTRVGGRRHGSRRWPRPDIRGRGRWSHGHG